MPNTESKKGKGKNKDNGPGLSDTARGVWKWVMGDMPLAPATSKQAKKAHRRRISGTRRDRAATGRPAPDPIAKAWEWIIGEQPLKLTGPDAPTKKESSGDGEGDGEREGGTGHKILEWVKGDQPLGNTTKKKKKAKPSKTPKNEKAKKMGKLPTWMKRHNHKPKPVPLIVEGSSTRLRADHGAHSNGSSFNDTGSVLDPFQDRDMDQGHHNNNERADSISGFSESSEQEHWDDEYHSNPVSGFSEPLERDVDEGAPPPTYSSLGPRSYVRTRESEGLEDEPASSASASASTTSIAATARRPGRRRR